MVAMRNATNTRRIWSILPNGIQQGPAGRITNDMLDISGGAEALLSCEMMLHAGTTNPLEETNEKISDNWCKS